MKYISNAYIVFYREINFPVCILGIFSKDEWERNIIYIYTHLIDADKTVCGEVSKYCS